MGALLVLEDVSETHARIEMEAKLSDATRRMSKLQSELAALQMSSAQARGARAPPPHAFNPHLTGRRRTTPHPLLTARPPPVAPRRCRRPRSSARSTW